MHTRRQSGFTLLETLFYLVLSGLMVAVLGGMSVNILNGKQKIVGEEAVAYNGLFVLETIERLIEESSGIIEPVAGATSTRLQLQMVDPNKDPAVITFSGDTIHLSEGSGPDVALTTGAVSVDRFFAQNITSSSSPGALYIELHISTHNPADRQEYRASEVFQTAYHLYDIQ